jgi:S-DNA-T family DNA segregation ATPase FtsK/SpoIIIE
MLKELIAEMERRFSIINGLSDEVCPEGKLTPQIAKRYDMPPVFVIIDELQEYFSALDPKEKEVALELLCRLARRGPAAGFILNLASQRPDSDSVPTKLREMISIRFSVRCVDKTSSDMVLGKGKAAIGADASLLSAEHKGVGVLVTGPAEFDTVRTDYIDLPAFSVVCEKGRALRITAKTLTGDAAGKLADLAAPQVTIPAILTDCLSVMRHAPTMHTSELLTGLAGLDDDAWGDLTPETLAAALESAGVVRSSKQVRAGADNQNLAGYRRADLEAAMPATWNPNQIEDERP